MQASGRKVNLMDMALILIVTRIVFIRGTGSKE